METQYTRLLQFSALPLSASLHVMLSLSNCVILHIRWKEPQPREIINYAFDQQCIDGDNTVHIMYNMLKYGRNDL